MNNELSGNLNAPQDESIDIRKWTGKLLSKWYWFIISVVLLVAAAYVYTRFLEPKYKVEATLLVKQERQSLGAEAIFSDMNLFGNYTNIQNEIGILQSWSLARRTLDNLGFDVSYVAEGRIGSRHLYESLPFRVTYGSGAESVYGIPIHVTLLNDTLFRIQVNDRYEIDEEYPFDQPFRIGEFIFILSPNPDFDKEQLPQFIQTDQYFFVVHDLNRLAESYQNKIEIELTDRQSSLLKLSTQGSKANREADYLNALMEEYIQSGLEEKNKTASNTVDFINNQLLMIVDTLRQAEEQLREFRSENKVIDISQEGQVILEQIDRLNNEKAMIDLQVQYYEYLLDYLENNDNFTNVMAPSTMGIDDQLLSSLLTNLVELSQTKSSLEYTAKEKNPELIRINLQIQANQENLIENVRNILNNAKLTQNDVDRRITRLNAQIQKLPETEMRLLNFERQFSLQSDIYNFLLQRRAEAGIAEASNVPDQKVIDRANPDMAEQVSPRTMINYAIGVLLGLLIPFLIIVLRDWLNNSIQEKADVENHTTVPIIGTVGHNKRDVMIPSIKFPRSSIAESFRAIRTNLQFTLHDEGKKVIMITSSTSGEGKTFIALNLAGIFSVSNKKVVVVGLDLRKPTLQKYMGVENKMGVSTFIIGRHEMSDIINPSEHPNLSIITSGPIPPNPAELFETDQFAHFIEVLRDKFDIVLLDTPPVALVTDAMLIGKHADTTLYVVRQKFTHKSAMAFVEDMKTKDHIQKLSIVINDVVVPKYYGYKYGYGYGYGYGKGYGSGYYTDDA